MDNLLSILICFLFVMSIVGFMTLIYRLLVWIGKRRANKYNSKFLKDSLNIRK